MQDAQVKVYGWSRGYLASLWRARWILSMLYNPTFWILSAIALFHVHIPHTCDHTARCTEGSVSWPSHGNCVVSVMLDIVFTSSLIMMYRDTSTTYKIRQGETRVFCTLAARSSDECSSSGRTTSAQWALSTCPAALRRSTRARACARTPPNANKRGAD